MKSIAFVGNCQAAAVRRIYAKFVAPRTGDKLHYIPTYVEADPQQVRIIAEADIVVELLMDAETISGLENVETKARKFRMPFVTAGWLWPNHGTPHPHRDQKRFQVSHMVDCTDAFLNRLVVQGVSPDEAADRYLNLGPKDFKGLDRRYEIMLEKQRQRDAITGYQTADLIEAQFRDESSFLTPFHPTLGISRYVALTLFEQMGVAGEDIERTRRYMRDSFYPRLEVPIHPAVVAHFGLRYLRPEHRYNWMSVGPITFREYAVRYMTWDVNDVLEQGLLDLEQGRPQAAIAQIAEGLRASPESAPGYIGLMRALIQLDRVGDAIDAGYAAGGRIAGDPVVRALHGIACAKGGRHAEAVEQLRISLDANPCISQTYMDLSYSLWRLGEHAEALRVLATGLDMEPWNTGFQERTTAITNDWKRLGQARAAPPRRAVAASATGG